MSCEGVANPLYSPLRLVHFKFEVQFMRQVVCYHLAIIKQCSSIVLFNKATAFTLNQVIFIHVRSPPHMTCSSGVVAVTHMVSAPKAFVQRDAGLRRVPEGSAYIAPHILRKQFACQKKRNNHKGM